MEFISLEVQNFKSIAQESVTFDSGIIVVYGSNGAGKSSFLEAAFFALYGSDSLPSHSKLEDVIKNGEDKMSVELTFEYNGEQYVIERSLRRRESGSPAHECQFRGDGDVVDKITEAERRIEELLRMDATSFLNCAYVRQGEIKLVEADASERKEMIDRLLQLGMLEEYRDRANQARLGAKSARENKEALLDEIAEDIETLEDKNLDERLDAVDREIMGLKRQKRELESDLEAKNNRLQEIEDELSQIDDIREEISELEDEQETVDEKLTQEREARDSKQSEVRELSENRTSLIDAVDSRLAACDDVDADTIDDLSTADGNSYDKSGLSATVVELENQSDEIADEVMDDRSEKKGLEKEVENLEDRADRKESRAADAEEDIEELEQSVESLQDSLSELKQEVEQRRDKIDDEKATFEDSSVDFGNAQSEIDRLNEELDDLEEEISDVERELSAARQSVEKAEELLEEGNCPECGQPVDGSPHVDSIEEERKRVEKLESQHASLMTEREELESQISRAEDLLDAESEVDALESEIERKQTEIGRLNERISESRDALDEKENTAERLREEAEELREEASQKRNRIQEIEDKVSAAVERRESVESSIDTIEEIVDDVDEVASLETEIGHLNEKIDSHTSIISEREERLDVIQSRLDELKEKYNESRISELESNQSSVEAEVEEIEDEIEEAEADLSKAQRRKGKVVEKMDALSEKRNRRRELDEEVEALKLAEEQAEDMKRMYSNLRSELREQNVTKLEQLFNEVFMELYQNNTYQRIELDNDYQLTIHDKKEGELTPQMLSGGEKVMFNLALRCAIYQLLAEATNAEENAPATLPPLILDEPTAHLDDSHVTQLSEVVELMRELGVGQTIVVSHQEEVVASADLQFEVSLDSTTNSSSIDRGRTTVL